MKQAHCIDKAPLAVGPYSHATSSDQLIFVSGQIPVVDGVLQTDIHQATKACLDNLKTILEGLGSDLDHVLKTTVLLKDMDDFQKMNEVYATYFTHDYPARSCFAVKELPKNALVEIEAIALKK